MTGPNIDRLHELAEFLDVVDLPQYNVAFYDTEALSLMPYIDPVNWKYADGLAHAARLACSRQRDERVTPSQRVADAMVYFNMSHYDVERLITNVDLSTGREGAKAHAKLLYGFIEKYRKAPATPFTFPVGVECAFLSAISLWDHYAGHALNAMITKSPFTQNDPAWEELLKRRADSAANYADAMMKERTQRGIK